MVALTALALNSQEKIKIEAEANRAETVVYVDDVRPICLLTMLRFA